MKTNKHHISDFEKELLHLEIGVGQFTKQDIRDLFKKHNITHINVEEYINKIFNHYEN